MTLLVRDEEDILDANLRYHFAAGVDFVIATDNLSVDGTSEILAGYEREGRLLRLEAHDDIYDQSRWVTRMARLAATEHGADWVINSDADEFWWPESGNLTNVLESVPERHGAVSVTRTNFVPRPSSAEPFFRSMTVRERTSLNALGQPLPGKACHRAYPDVLVEMGNHGAARTQQDLTTVNAALTIFHFPLRTYAQFENKIAKGGAALERNPAFPPNLVATWRMLYGLLLNGELESYYESLVLSDAAVASGLANGTLVRDERLLDALDELYSKAGADA